jgi:hypothetical protein
VVLILGKFNWGPAIFFKLKIGFFQGNLPILF